MNRKHRKVLEAIFNDPVSPTIEWRAIEGLLVALGCTVIEGKGSTVRFTRDSVIAYFHRPHPDKMAKRYQVRDAREFLRKIGEEP